MHNFYEEIKIKNLNSAEKKLITDYFCDFYKFLETLFNDKNFFANSISDLNTKLLNILKQENILIIYLNDESSAYLQYYTRKERRINIINAQGERTTALF
jgi:hypothetical protein